MSPLPGSSPWWKPDTHEPTEESHSNNGILSPGPVLWGLPGPSVGLRMPVCRPFGQSDGETRCRIWVRSLEGGVDGGSAAPPRPPGLRALFWKPRRACEADGSGSVHAGAPEARWGGGGDGDGPAVVPPVLTHPCRLPGQSVRVPGWGLERRGRQLPPLKELLRGGARADDAVCSGQGRARSTGGTGAPGQG